MRDAASAYTYVRCKDPAAINDAVTLGYLQTGYGAVKGVANLTNVGRMVRVSAAGTIGETDISVGAADGIISRAGSFYFGDNAEGTPRAIHVRGRKTGDSARSAYMQISPTYDDAMLITGVTTVTVGAILGLTGTTAAYPAAADYPMIYRTGATGTGLFAEAGHLVISPRTSLDRDVIFAGGTTPAEKARFKMSAGALLIGTTTVVGTELFRVNKSAVLNSSGFGTNVLISGSFGAASSNLGLSFAVGSTTAASAGIYVTDAGAAGSNLLFTTAASYSTPTQLERMRINSSGQVLIGSTTATTGLLQLASGTTSANGVGFGSEHQIYRESATILRSTLDMSINGVRVGLGGGAVSTNTCVGTGAMAATATGTNTVAVGNTSLAALTSGVGNTAIGGLAAVNLTTGSYNIAVGIGAGRYHSDGATALTDPENSIYIGALCRGQNNSDNNSIVIGYSAIGKGANTAVWGNTSVTNHYFAGNMLLAGAAAVGTSGAGVVGLANGTAPSSSPADMFQLYSNDQAAGNACPHFRTENGAIIKLYQLAHVADPSGGATVDAEARSAVNSILTTLESLGFHAAA
jgi:hypothetical protein